MRERSQQEPSHESFGEDDLPTKPDARPIPLYRGVGATPARSQASESDEDEGEEEDEFDEFDEFDDAAALRETRAGALATSAWDRTHGSSAFESGLGFAGALVEEETDAFADTERHPMFSDIEAPTDVDLEPFSEPEDRG